MYGPEEVFGSFIVASGDSPILLEFSEEVFDAVTVFIEMFVKGTLDYSV